MQQELAQKITDVVREMVVIAAPEVKEKAMYGGIVFELDYLKPKRIFCGIFTRKDYVTIEFDRGSELHDDHHFLEGEGKGRRHLKIRAFSELVSKNAEGFIQQSLDLH